MKKQSKLWILISLLWMGMIFFRSFQPASQSSQESVGLLLKLRPIFPMLTEPVLRKIAHFIEFGVLGVLVSHSPLSLGGQLLLGLCTAVADETIQLFVPGRSGEIRDVWIDFFGVLIGCVVMYALLTLIRRRKGHA